MKPKEKQAQLVAAKENWQQMKADKKVMRNRRNTKRAWKEHKETA